MLVVFLKNQFINILLIISLKLQKWLKYLRKILILILLIFLISFGFAEEINDQNNSFENQNKFDILNLYNFQTKILAKIPIIFNYDVFDIFNKLNIKSNNQNIIYPKRVVDVEIIKAIGNCKLGQICEQIYVRETNYCAQFSVIAAKKIYAVDYDLDHAWLLNQKQNNIVVWNKDINKKISYSDIPEGAILGIITKNNNQIIDQFKLDTQKYTHVVLFVGKIDGVDSIISLEKDGANLFSIKEYLKENELVEIILPRK